MCLEQPTPSGGHGGSVISFAGPAHLVHPLHTLCITGGHLWTHKLVYKGALISLIIRFLNKEASAQGVQSEKGIIE